MSRVLLGVTGGIAAYKACELCRLLVREGHDVVPLVTPGAERFVNAETFRALARRPPAEDVYLHLTRADLLVVAPCTANTLAKLANGLADNVLTEAARAPRRGPLRRQPLVRADGRRARGRGAPARCRGDAARGEPRGAGPGRSRARRDAVGSRSRARGARARGRGRRGRHGRGGRG